MANFFLVLQINLKKAENNQLQCQTNLRINNSINVTPYMGTEYVQRQSCQNTCQIPAQNSTKCDQTERYLKFNKIIFIYRY